MKKVKEFSKLFKATIILYIVFVIAGIVFIATKGLNRGVDFQSGLVAQVRFAPTVLSLSYSGPDTVTFSQDNNGIYIVTTSINAENKTKSFLFSEYKTVGDFIANYSKVDGLNVISAGYDDIALNTLFTSSSDGSKLSEKPLRLHSLEANKQKLTSDNLRQSLSSLDGLTVQQLGDLSEQSFQLRLASDDVEKNSNVSEVLASRLTAILSETYGAENYAYLSTDFMGSQFSASLVRQSALLVLLSIGLIFIYVMVRFKWNFALAAIIALLVDTFTMVFYMGITQMEFSSVTIAALLTIIGYSVNDTVVMFDRIRENTRLFPDMIGTQIIDKSLTEVLGRSIITTLTTVSAVLILFVFTDGSSSDFANVLLIGLISGVITTLFLSSAVLNLTCAEKKGQEIIRSSVAT